jgi:putative hydrolase of the HAD superfamily
MEKHGYEPGELVIVGDDPDSEICAGTELGATTILYDHERRHEAANATYKISRYKEFPDL